MVERIKRLYRLLLVLILREPPPETPPPPKAAKESTRDADLYSFKAHILDYLDDQFEVLGRMKKYDREAYTLYKKVGAFIMADMWRFENAWDYEEYRHMRGWWKTHRPSFAAFYMGYQTTDDACDDRIHPRFLYFRKYDSKKQPVEIQRAHGDGDTYAVHLSTAWGASGVRLDTPALADGDTYTVSLYYDDPAQGGMVARYAVHVTPEGEIRCLKTLMDDPVVVRVKRKSGHGPRGRTFRVPNRKWEFPPLFEAFAAEHKRPIEDLLIGNFVMAVLLQGPRVLQNTQREPETYFSYCPRSQKRPWDRRRDICAHTLPRPPGFQLEWL